MIRKYYILFSLLWFAIAVLLGTLLRSSFMIAMGSWFNFQFILHTHSHLAILGWVFNISYYFLIKQFNLLDKNKYANLFLMLNLSVLGMLFTFPFEGYALWSIIFSTLHIIFSIVFGIYFFIDTKSQKGIPLKFALAGIFFMIFSALGPLSLGPIVSMGLKTSIWYNLAIYFYIHFQYNGWFLFTIISIVLFQINKFDKDNWQRAFNLFFLSTIFNYSLSTLWTNPGWVINILSVLSSLMQLHALFLMSKDLIVHFRTLDKFNSYIYKIIFALIVIKIFLSLIGSIQEVAFFVYYNRNLVIGYLHLVFLGIVTPFFFQQIAKDLSLNLLAKYKRPMLIYLFFFILSEILLGLSSIGLKGSAIMIISDFLVYTTWILAGITLHIITYFVRIKLSIEKIE